VCSSDLASRMFLVQGIQDVGQHHSRSLQTCSPFLQSLLMLALLVALLACLPPSAWAACTVERAVSGEPALFVRHFSQDCTKAERDRKSVPAREILEARK